MPSERTEQDRNGRRWATNALHVRTAADNRQINDMYGFPAELYQVHYAPAGSTEYANKVLDLLGSSVTPDNSWGIDHGIWSVLSNMYPEADVPVVMLSVNVKAGAEEQYEIGKKLAGLRQEGVMIFASGNVVHNLQMVNWEMDNGYDWAENFDRYIRDAILAGNPEAVVQYDKITRSSYAVPTTEHFYPLLTALGAVLPEDKVTVWNEYCELGTMSMTSYLFEE